MPPELVSCRIKSRALRVLNIVGPTKLIRIESNAMKDKLRYLQHRTEICMLFCVHFKKSPLRGKSGSCVVRYVYFLCGEVQWASVW